MIFSNFFEKIWISKERLFFFNELILSAFLMKITKIFFDLKFTHIDTFFFLLSSTMRIFVIFQKTPTLVTEILLSVFGIWRFKNHFSSSVNLDHCSAFHVEKRNGCGMDFRHGVISRKIRRLCMPYLYMSLHMERQVVRSWETPITVATFEWFSSCVLPIVTCKFITSCESPFASFPRAFIRLFTWNDRTKKQKCQYLLQRQCEYEFLWGFSSVDW